MIRLNLLGPPRVLVHGSEVVSLRSRLRNLAVLCVVVVEGRIGKERLQEMLWGNRAPRLAAQSLSQALGDLRRELGSDWYVDGRPHLEVGHGVSCDYHEFADLAQRDPADAVSLARGAFLDGVFLDVRGFDAWAMAHRDRVDAMYASAFRQRCAALIKDGGVPEALEVARLWAIRLPMSDEANHALVGLSCLAGDRAGGIRAFDRYMALLTDLGLPPDDGVLSAVGAIRAGGHDSDAGLLLPPSLFPPSRDANSTRNLWRGQSDRATPFLLRIENPRSTSGDVIPLRAGSVALDGIPGDIAAKCLRVVKKIGPGGEAEYYVEVDEETAVFRMITGPHPLEVGDEFIAGRHRYHRIELRGPVVRADDWNQSAPDSHDAR